MCDLYRIDLNGLVHVVAHIPSRQRDDCWTPMCQPNEDWLILEGSNAHGPPTCLWCITDNRFR